MANLNPMYAHIYAPPRQRSAAKYHTAAKAEISDAVCRIHFLLVCVRLVPLPSSPPIAHIMYANLIL